MVSNQPPFTYPFLEELGSEEEIENNGHAFAIAIKN